MRKKTLLMAMLAMVLAVAGSALAQVPPDPGTDGTTPVEETTPMEETAPAPATPAAPAFSLGADGDTLTVTEGDSSATFSCYGSFRGEQLLLPQSGYPTSESGVARACEDLGAVNPFPFPYFYDTAGFLYTFDPLSDAYYTELDEASGLIYLYDLITDAFYSYDPATGVYAPA